jgi:hypothetical protein
LWQSGRAAPGDDVLLDADVIDDSTAHPAWHERHANVEKSPCRIFATMPSGSRRGTA